MAKVAGVRLQQVEGPDASPGVALNALDDSLAGVVQLEGQIVRLQQFQGERHSCQVPVVHHRPHDLLGQRLAIAQPGAAHQALHLRPGQLAGSLRAQRPLSPRALDLGAEIQMHRTGQIQHQRFNADASTAHHALLQAVEQAGTRRHQCLARFAIGSPFMVSPRGQISSALLPRSGGRSAYPVARVARSWPSSLRSVRRPGGTCRCVPC